MVDEEFLPKTRLFHATIGMVDKMGEKKKPKKPPSKLEFSMGPIFVQGLEVAQET